MVSSFLRLNDLYQPELIMKIKFFIAFLLTWQIVCAQHLYKAVEDYFPANPFKTEFSLFINNLLKDPALVERDIKKKTDSTLFFLQGIYQAHSPFFFPSTRCKIILAEQQEYMDSTSAEAYTFFVYQLIGYANPGAVGLRDIKEEFERMNRRLKKGLAAEEQKILKRGSEQSGAIINYSYKDTVFNPLTIAWATSADNKENIIVLSIRFFLIDNKAYLPIPADSP